MNIGRASAATGVSAKMIRHYEAIGLLRPAARKENSYRDYGGHEVHELRFIGRARKLGFSMAEIAALLALWRQKGRSSREVKRVATSHLADLETRIAEMQSVAATLRQLVRACRGDERPDCPILADLAGEENKRPHDTPFLGAREGCVPTKGKDDVRGAKNGPPQGRKR